MKNLEFVRIDDRLIHGQVVAAWLKAYSNVKYILVIDDKTSEDPFMHEMFKLLVPAGITIDIKTIADATEQLREPLEKPTMIIVKNPMTIKSLVDNGIEFERVNIGGMGMTPGRKKLFQNISSTPEENDIIRELIKQGIEVEIQIIPAAKVVNLKSVLGKEDK
ncbi:MAG TPA: PTS sugar transporter subunit IIB [Erysipelothrix sp.]|jgi:PTS system mannose-specific IIB component|nr:PTS sugar transporter subunit IIB [Erysipelothrix sp.]